MKIFRRALLSFLFVIPAVLLADSAPPHPEGLLLRGFESQAALNRRGLSAVSHGVATTMRIDAAGEVSADRGPADLAPLIDWYQDRGNYYAAYATFSPGLFDAIGFLDAEVSSAGKTLDLDGNEDGICLFLPEAYDAIVAVAEAYVDAGVDAIEYDTAWVHGGAGPFDPATLAAFRDWLNSRYSLTELQALIDPAYDAATFDYRAFLNAGGITAANYSGASIGGTPLFQTKHWRLWQAFLRAQERAVVAALVDEVNTYATNALGHEIGFFFNRYGFINRPADRWYLAEYASGDLGETHFSGQSWTFEKGYSLEPVFRAALKKYDNRFEPWNSPPKGNTAVQSVFLAETIANNGVATWEDDIPATAPVARFARRFAAQLDHEALADVAIFYPLATANHNRPMQSGTQPVLGGSHYWYLGLGYLMQDLNLQYDVAFGGDGLGLPDDFSAGDLAGYETLFVAEAIQVTDSQFTVVLDWVNAGGTLLVMGTDCFRYDALGEDQSATRSYGALSWSNLFGSAGETVVGSGTVKCLSAEPWGSNYYSYRGEADSSQTTALATIRASVLSALPANATTVSHTTTGNVRLLRYLDEADGSEVYHLLNYTFNATGTSVTGQAGFDVTVPAPAGFAGTPTATYAFEEDSDPVALSLTDHGDGTYTVTIPSLVYWGILRLGSAIDATPHPVVPPIAELAPFFSYEVFGDTLSRDLTYSAADDGTIQSLQIYYQAQDPTDLSWGPWTAGGYISGFDPANLENQTVAYTLPGEGHFRLQLVATDDEGASNALMPDGYDTEIGYDSTPPETTDLQVTVDSGPANGGVTTTPVGPTLTVSGATDPISDLFQVLYDWGNDSASVEAGGIPVELPEQTFTLPAPTEGAYNTYTFTLRYQNYANLWNEPEIVYSYIYTVPPSYTGSAESATANVNDYVQFDLAYSNPYGDVSIQWYKDGALLEGETANYLALSNVTSDDNGTYAATITNPAGTITSTDFDLTVITPLQVTSQPAGAVINEGDAFTVTVVAEGTGTLHYQWTLENIDVPGATSASYSVASATRAEHHGHYRCVITDDLTSVTSNGAFVQINGGGGGGGGGSFNISITLPQGGPLPLDVVGSDLLDNLRARIQTSASLPDNNFYLYKGPTELTGNNSLASYGISSGTTLTVSFTPLGGGGGGSFNISVNVPASTPLALDVVGTDTVGDLRTRVATATGMSGDAFDLLFNTTNLTNTPEATLASFGIQAGSALNLVIKSGGGSLSIHFQSPDGSQQLDLSFNSTDTLGAVRDSLASTIGESADTITMRFNDSVLSNLSLTLAEAGIADASTIVISIALTYQHFADSVFGGATALVGPWEDFDGDGMENFLEYFFGRDPTTAGEEDEEQFVLIAQGGTAFLRWTRRLNASDVIFGVELTTDSGQTWTSALASDFEKTSQATAAEGVNEVHWTYQGPLTGSVFFRGWVREKVIP